MSNTYPMNNTDSFFQARISASDLPHGINAENKQVLMDFGNLNTPGLYPETIYHPGSEMGGAEFVSHLTEAHIRNPAYDFLTSSDDKEMDNLFRSLSREGYMKSQASTSSHTPLSVYKENSKWVCSFCRKGYVRKAHCYDHLNTHRGGGIKAYQCRGECGDSECTRSFQYAEGHRAHQQHQPKRCPCNIMVRPKNLARHLRTQEHRRRMELIGLKDEASK